MLIFCNFRTFLLVSFFLGVALPCTAQTAFINEFHTNDANGGFTDLNGDGNPDSYTDLEFVEFAIETESGTRFDSSNIIALFYDGEGAYANYAIGPSYWTQGEGQGDYTLYSYGPFGIPLNSNPEDPSEGAIPDDEGAIALTWWDENKEVLHLIDVVSYGDTVSIRDDPYVGTITVPPIGMDERPAPASDTSALALYSLGLTGVLETSSQDARGRQSKTSMRMIPHSDTSLLLRRPTNLLERVRQFPTRPSKAHTAPLSGAPDGLEWTVFANTASPGLPNTNQALPIELVRFDGVASNSGAVLSWSTATETRNAGFSVEHAHQSQAFSEVAFVQSPGPSDTLRTYEHRIEELTPGRHRFRLRHVDIDGQVAYSRAIEVQISLPGAVHVSSPSPTPFRAHTSFTVSTKRSMPLTVSVFDAVGREVSTLWNGTTEANEIHTFSLSASRDNLSSGIYFIRVHAPGRSITRKTVLVR